jgi:hypothetical protein
MCIALRCTDGVVIAADGMCSHNIQNSDFVGVDNLKTHIIDNKIILACAGNDAYLQYFLIWLNQNAQELLQVQQGKTPEMIISHIHGGFFTYLEQQNNYFPPGQRQVLSQQLQQNFVNNFSCLIGFIYDENYYLYTIQGFNCAPVLESGSWHPIIGLGFLQAEPSIHLIKRIMNISEKPDVMNGINLAYWTVQHTIDVSAGGIGGDISIVYIKKNNDSEFIVERAGIEQSREFVNSMYSHIRSYFQPPAQEVEIAPALETNQ